MFLLYKTGLHCMKHKHSLKLHRNIAKTMANTHGKIAAAVKLWNPLNASPEVCISDSPQNFWVQGSHMKVLHDIIPLWESLKELQ